MTIKISISAADVNWPERFHSNNPVIDECIVCGRHRKLATDTGVYWYIYKSEKLSMFRYSFSDDSFMLCGGHCNVAELAVLITSVGLKTVKENIKELVSVCKLEMPSDPVKFLRDAGFNLIRVNDDGTILVAESPLATHILFKSIDIASVYVQCKKIDSVLGHSEYSLYAYQNVYWSIGAAYIWGTVDPIQ